MQQVIRGSVAMFSVALLACVRPSSVPRAAEVVTIQVKSVDSTRQVSFALDVTGGSAALRNAEMSGNATNARLTALTPAEITLSAGTRGVVFTSLDNGVLAVSGGSQRGNFAGTGTRLHYVQSADRFEIRSY